MSTSFLFPWIMASFLFYLPYNSFQIAHLGLAYFKPIKTLENRR